MTSVPARRQALYAMLWDLAEPISLAGEPAGETFRGLLYPTATLARLGETFLEADLVAAGLAVRDHDGGIALASIIAQRGDVIGAVRDSAGAAPIDLVTQGGMLSGAEPALALLGSYDLHRAYLNERDYLFITFSINDLAWMWAAGLPAVLVPAVASFTPVLVQALEAGMPTLICARHGDTWPGSVDPQPEQATSSPTGSTATEAQTSVTAAEGANGAAAPEESLATDREPGAAAEVPQLAHDEWRAPSIVIVAWSPAIGSLDAPTGLGERLQQLGRVQEAMPFDFPAVGVWSPKASDVEVFLTIHRYGTLQQLRNAILESVEQSARTLASIDVVFHENDYITARAAYHEVLKSSVDQRRENLDLLEADYRRAVERELVAPLLQYAAICSRPAKRALYAAMAETCLLVQQLAPRASRDVEDRHSIEAGRSTRDFLAAVKLLVSTAKELQ